VPYCYCSCQCLFNYLFSHFVPFCIEQLQ
jgi:hypothetical protein